MILQLLGCCSLDPTIQGKTFSVCVCVCVHVDWVGGWVWVHRCACVFPQMEITAEPLIKDPLN